MSGRDKSGRNLERLVATLERIFAGTGARVEVLESNLIGDGTFDTSLPDYWRFAADGRATIIRPYREDRERSVQGTGRAAGSWLSPETIVRETAELVTHARLVAERPDSASAVAFRCSWRGLASRDIAGFGSEYWSPGKTARAAHRTTSGTWPVATLSANWHSVVADLACPVLALFGMIGCGPALVEGMAPGFRTL